MKFLIFIFLFLLPVAAHAQAIPLDKLAIRLVPRGDEVNGEVGIKTIKIVPSDNGIKLAWFSMVKIEDEAAEFPTFKIKAKRGMIEVDSLEGKISFYQPNLWGNGFARVENSLPLWVSPEYLDSEKQEKMFSVGLLNIDKNYLKTAPEELLSEFRYFQNLYDQVVAGLQNKSLPNVKKAEEKELRDFVRDFFYVKVMAKTKASLVVNGTKETYPAKIIGNEYFHLVVIDDPLNPLVVTFKLFPEKSPRLFKKSFDFFKKNSEYVITQVSY